MAMQWFVEAHGVPPEKLLVGLPVYDSAERALHDILTAQGTEPDQNEAGGAWFNGQMMVEEKARLVGALGFGGMFMFQINYDTKEHPKSLLHAAAVGAGLESSLRAETE